ncbi:MAG TPA: hypothetical protein VGM84_25315 [Steroidobacteraceae bacterium]|jgi:hypothetical protein
MPTLPTPQPVATPPPARNNRALGILAAGTVLALLYFARDVLVVSLLEASCTEAHSLIALRSEPGDPPAIGPCTPNLTLATTLSRNKQTSGASSEHIQVRGARENNLKNIDVDVPRESLVVFSGISGSGKSSLAFGTLYAEAQRRYFESVSPYARRLIDQVGAPDVDSIEGLPPAVALKQQRGATSTRSSVGSVTAISNLLRMLFSRAGEYPDDQPLLHAGYTDSTLHAVTAILLDLARIVRRYDQQH